MRFKLKGYQDEGVRSILTSLGEAKGDYREKDRKLAFALSAITGAGKTVMAAAVLEALFGGSQEFEVDGDPTAVVLWVTDDPNLNEQTRYRIMQASDQLDSSRLTIISDDFVAEKFTPGKVYFLNRQKLTGKSFITYTDKRTYTLWDTIGNTIEDGSRTLYMVLDEAHRGVRPQSQSRRAADEQHRATTVLRLINGDNGVPPVPIVWGISATVDRFNTAMKNARDRTILPTVTVDNAAVQASGLLKDTISLDLPNKPGAFTTVFAREAARISREASQLWHEYGQAEGLTEPVCPLLVVQVPNKPSASELAAMLDTIYESWPELAEDAIANVFGEHADEEFGRHRVPYIAPQDVQDASHVRVLLAKDAISTGWDCPRAETLVSLRAAKDRTHITQLLGRLVRTPLARRVDSDERLNRVTCFLPHFDLKAAKEVADVMTGAREDSDGPAMASGGRTLINPQTMLWNSNVPDEVAVCMQALPSKAAPKAPAKPIRRMLKMAAEIAVDELIPKPDERAHEMIYGVLEGQAAQHTSEVDSLAKDIVTADIKRIVADRLSRQATETSLQVAGDQRTISDAFRRATRAFGASIANGYAKRVALANSGGDFDIYEAQAKVAALASLGEVVDQVESTAEKVVNDWFSALHAQIKALNEERRSAYDEIREEADKPQKIDLIVPTSRIEMTYALDGERRETLPTRPLHILSDQEGNYPVEKLRGWELEVLDTEMARKETVGWYRNPSSASKDSLQVPWHDGNRWRSMQPDFIFFSKNSDGDLVASLVDPHGHHLQDALGKLRGLANFAEEFGASFLRIEAISKNNNGDLGSDGKGALRMLDMTVAKTRKVVREVKSAADAYRLAGQGYQ